MIRINRESPPGPIFSYTQFMKKQLFSLLLSCLFCYHAKAGPAKNDEGWWPVQKAPKEIVTCTINRSSDIREMNLAQSVSGLAAQALNEGATGEGVWIATTNPDYKIYYKSLVKRIKAKETGEFDAWELVDRYKRRGIIKGYVLYDFNSKDNSVNLATVYAGIKIGILIDIS